MPTQHYIGEIMIFTGSFAPEGWLECDGRMLHENEHQALFSVIERTYGGSSPYFALPDLRGRAAVGQGSPGFPQGASGGASDVTLNASQLPKHSHALLNGKVGLPVSSADADTNDPTQGVPAKLSVAVDDGVSGTYKVTAKAYTTGAATGIRDVKLKAGTQTGEAGSDKPAVVHIQNPYLALRYCIATEGEYPSGRNDRSALPAISFAFQSLHSPPQPSVMKCPPKKTSVSLEAFGFRRISRSWGLAALLTAVLALSAQAASPIKLFFDSASSTNTNDRLDRIDVDGTNLTALITTGVGTWTQPETIQIDHANGYLYIADGGAGHQILRFNLDGTNKTVITSWTHTGFSRGLALDRVNQKLYYCTQSTTVDADNTLVSINLSNNSATTLGSGAANVASRPSGLAVDTERGYVYVSDFQTSSATSQGIVRFNLDGSGRTQIVTHSPLSGGTSMTFPFLYADESTGHLYFTTNSTLDSNLDRIARINWDGTGMTTLYSGATNFTQPYAIFVDKANGYIYMGDSNVGAALASLYRFNLDGSGGRLLMANGYENNGFIDGIALTSTAPTISTVSNQNVAMGASTGNLSVTVGDAASETPVGNLLLYGKSSNQTLVPNANITFGGSGASRTVNVATAAGQTGTSTITLTVNDGAVVTRTTFTVTVASSTAPTVTTPTSASITGTSATLGGNVTSDGGATITGRGVVYSVTSTNSNPQIGGTGVSQASTSGTTGVFTVGSGTLPPGTAYSFAAYAINSVGTSYSSVGTFTTLSDNADLSALSFSAGTISFSTGTTSYSFSVPNATANTTVTATRSEANATLQLQFNAGGFTSLTSGTASGSLSLNVGANTVDVKVTAQDGTTIKTYTTTITRAAPLSAPTVTTPTSASIAGTAATLGGNVTSDGGATITERGVVYSVTSTNSNPQINGTGVTKVSTTGTTGVFTVSSGTLTPGTAYSFAAYATNSVGTSYSSVGSFTTLSDNANLSNLTISSGTLSPVFASVIITYDAAVLRPTTSITVTPTAAESHATIQVRINGGSYASVTSGSPTSSLPLNLGANTIDVLVTAQDGATTKTYTTTVTRWTYLQAWRNQYYGSIANSGDGADTAAPQFDGLANLLKFALGMNPTVPGLQPVTFVKNGSTLEFSYPRSVEATVECTFIVEWSDTLMPGSWDTAGVNEQILSDNGTLQQVKATLPAGNPVRRFVRLRVTNP